MLDQRTGIFRSQVYDSPACCENPLLTEAINSLAQQLFLILSLRRLAGCKLTSLPPKGGGTDTAEAVSSAKKNCAASRSDVPVAKNLL